MDVAFGTELSEKSPAARRKIETLLEKCDDISEISVELMRQRDCTENMLKKLGTFRDKQTKYSQNIKEKKDKIERNNKRLKEISDQLKGINIEQIERHEREIGNLKQKRDEIIQDIAIKESTITSLGKEILDLEKNYKDELGKIEKRDDLKEILLFCEDALEAVGKIKNEIMEEIRIQVEIGTKVIVQPFLGFFCN